MWLVRDSIWAARWSRARDKRRDALLAPSLCTSPGCITSGLRCVFGLARLSPSAPASSLAGISVAETESPASGSYAGTVRVRRQLFCSEQDGYAVLAVTDEDSGDELTVVGPLGHLSAGERAEVSGEWQQHSRYGPQLRASGAKPLDPADRDGQIAYLTSLRHIGPARAERLADRHGEAVLEAIAADPAAVFAALRGVSARQAEAAAQSWHASRAVRDLHVQLAPHGLAHLAAPIHARYGAEAMQVLHEDPYGLTEIDGVGFARADLIALAADVPRESDRRAEAAAAFTLAEAERQGTPTCRWRCCGAAAPSCSASTPTPTSSPLPPACWSTRDASTASPPTPASFGARRR